MKVCYGVALALGLLILNFLGVASSLRGTEVNKKIAKYYLGLRKDLREIEIGIDDIKDTFGCNKSLIRKVEIAEKWLAQHHSIRSELSDSVNLNFQRFAENLENEIQKPVFAQETLTPVTIGGEKEPNIKEFMEFGENLKIIGERNVKKLKNSLWVKFGKIRRNINGLFD